MSKTIHRLPLRQLRANPSNPRTITQSKLDKLVQSLRQFPQMLELRPLVVESLDNPVVLGGNMRLRALQQLGVEEVPVLEASELSAEQRGEFVIKDNVGFGEWDWEALANEWDPVELSDWGLDLPGVNLDQHQLTDEFTLPDGDKEPFQQMAFTLADQQAEVVKNALAEIKKTEEYKYCETFGNENSNGNALYLIIATWAGQRI